MKNSLCMKLMGQQIFMGIYHIFSHFYWQIMSFIVVSKLLFGYLSVDCISKNINEGKDRKMENIRSTQHCIVSEWEREN